LPVGSLYVGLSLNRQCAMAGSSTDLASLIVANITFKVAILQLAKAMKSRVCTHHASP
jgi:hypothetical protein